MEKTVTTKTELSEYGKKFMQDYTKEHGMLPKGSRVSDVTYDPKTKTYSGKVTHE